MNAKRDISHDVLQQAAEWLVQLQSGSASQEDRLACERWRLEHPDHALAWARAETLLGKLGTLPKALAMPTLDRPKNAERRAAVLKLTCLLAALPAGWAAWRFAEYSGWNADLHTKTGERRVAQLTDGSTVTLNTASSIDIRFDAAQRSIRLLRGEIFIETAKDRREVRPFGAWTEQGYVQALGTRFCVRQCAGSTQVTVFEDAVRITPRQAPKGTSLVLEAGQMLNFTEERVQKAVAPTVDVQAWTRGMMMVDRMRLIKFVAELARYRNGIIRCDSSIENMLISGTFPIDDTNYTLKMITNTYPVIVRERLSGYWVDLAPA